MITGQTSWIKVFARFNTDESDTHTRGLGYVVWHHLQHYFSYIIAESYIGGGNHRSPASYFIA